VNWESAEKTTNILWGRELKRMSRLSTRCRRQGLWLGTSEFCRLNVHDGTRNVGGEGRVVVRN